MCSLHEYSSANNNNFQESEIFLVKVYTDCRTILRRGCVLLCWSIALSWWRTYSIFFTWYWISNIGLVTPDFSPPFCCTSWAIKIFGPRLLYNSIWGQCKSLGFLHLLIPNPFSPFLRHTALGIKRLEKGAGSPLGAGSFSSCFEDDGQWLLRKPSGFQMHSWAVLLCDAWCLCLCSTNRVAHARYATHMPTQIYVRLYSHISTAESFILWRTLVPTDTFYMLTLKFVYRQNLIAPVFDWHIHE